MSLLRAATFMLHFKFVMPGQPGLIPTLTKVNNDDIKIQNEFINT